MTSRARFRVAAALLLVAFTASAAVNWWQSRELARSAKEQQEILVAAGWEPVVKAKPRELADMVPDIDLSAPAVAETPVVAAARVVTEQATFQPSPQVCEPVGPQSDSEGISEAVPRLFRPPPITLAVDLQGAVTQTAEGRLFWQGKLFADLGQGNWSERRRMPIKSSVFAVSPEIQRALTAYAQRPSRISLRPRPVKHWRIGWSAVVGPSWTLDGRLTASVTIGMGIQF